jgi:hypothetical protein
MDARLGNSKNPYRRDTLAAAEWLEGYSEQRLPILDAERRREGWA